MAKKPENQGKEWTKEQENLLVKLAKGDTPTGLIAYKEKRSEASIYNKAQELGVTLDPVNKSPYNRHNKNK